MADVCIDYVFCQSALYGSRGDGTHVKKPKKKSRLRDDFMGMDD